MSPCRRDGALDRIKEADELLVAMAANGLRSKTFRRPSQHPLSAISASLAVYRPADVDESINLKFTKFANDLGNSHAALNAVTGVVGQVQRMYRPKNDRSL